MVTHSVFVRRASTTLQPNSRTTTAVYRVRKKAHQNPRLASPDANADKDGPTWQVAFVGFGCQNSTRKWDARGVFGWVQMWPQELQR
jgi:hypothetical protein